MAPSGPAPQQLSVDDILAFSDAELVEYMKQNRRADGGFDLDVDGWEHLQKEQRDQLAARLKIGAQKANDVAESRPVDLDQVTARLHQLSDGRDALAQPPPGPSRRERAPTEEVDWDAMAKRCETFAYNELLAEGGLPAYPIDLLEEVAADPEKYRDRLRLWQEYPDGRALDWKDVFEKQLKRWRDFRAWQIDNRELQDEEREYLEFLERRKLDEERLGFDWLKAFPGSTESEYYEDRKTEWDERQVRRHDDWFWLREDRGRGGFPGYVEEAKRRLAKHGFTRTFQLDEDPKRQDKLTTWIEYLNYEYSWYDRYTRLSERRQPKYDEAWQKLVDSGVLRPGETDEFLRTTESSHGRQTAKDQARAAVEFAVAAANAALRESEKAKHGQSLLTVQERKRRLARAHSQLDSAKQALKMAVRRSDLIREFIRGTWPWLREKRNVYRHSLLVQWILEQVPVIEAEMNQPKMTESSSHGARDVETPRRDQDVKVTENRRSSRLKQPRQMSTCGAGALTQERRPSKHDRPDDVGSDGRSAKRLKESGSEAASHPVSSDKDIQAQRPEVKRRNEHDPEALIMGKAPGIRPRNRSDPSTDMPQLPARPPALRRSARIAARLDKRTQGPGTDTSRWFHFA